MFTAFSRWMRDPRNDTVTLSLKLAALSFKGVTAHGGPTGPLQFDRLEAIPGRQFILALLIASQDYAKTFTSIS
jgi:hypothetical protein